MKKDTPNTETTASRRGFFMGAAAAGAAAAAVTALPALDAPSAENKLPPRTRKRWRIQLERTRQALLPNHTRLIRSITCC